MMFNMQDAPQTETPLGDLLPRGVKTLLQRNGVHTVEDVRNAYPHQLLRMRGMGMFRFRQIEAALIKGECYTPRLSAPPLPDVPGSGLKNSPLPSAIVRNLARNGILNEQQLRDAYPEKLLQIRTFGMGSLREVERIFFPGQRYEPPTGRRPAPVLPDILRNMPGEFEF